MLTVRISVCCSLETETFSVCRTEVGRSLQHGVQLVGQVIKHVANVIQNIACCLHCGAPTRKQMGQCEVKKELS